MISQLMEAGEFPLGILRASHRIDEKSWSAGGVDQDRGSNIRDSFPSRRGGQGAPPQRGQAADGFYSV